MSANDELDRVFGGEDGVSPIRFGQAEPRTEAEIQAESCNCWTAESTEHALHCPYRIWMSGYAYGYDKGREFGQAEAARRAAPRAEGLRTAPPYGSDPIDDAIQYAIAYMNDPEGLAGKREEWRDNLRAALQTRRAEAAQEAAPPPGGWKTPGDPSIDGTDFPEGAAPRAEWEVHRPGERRAPLAEGLDVRSVRTAVREAFRKWGFAVQIPETMPDGMAPPIDGLSFIADEIWSRLAPQERRE